MHSPRVHICFAPCSSSLYSILTIYVYALYRLRHSFGDGLEVKMWSPRTYAVWRDRGRDGEARATMCEVLCADMRARDTGGEWGERSVAHWVREQQGSRSAAFWTKCARAGDVERGRKE